MYTLGGGITLDAESVHIPDVNSCSHSIPVKNSNIDLLAIFFFQF